MRHGPHHSAQKSTSTGTSEFRTSLSQLASVKVRVFAPAIVFPILLVRCRYGQKDSTRQKLLVQLPVLPGGSAPREIFEHSPPHHARPTRLILIGRQSRTEGIQQRASGIIPEFEPGFLINR